MREHTSRTVLVTSGLGPRFGGIGVVSTSLLSALARHGPASTWKHHHTWPRSIRVPALTLRTLLDAGRRPLALIFYEHVDLARLSVVAPWLRKIPYAVFLHGTEVWKALDGGRREALERASLLMINSQKSLDRARSANPWLPHAEVNWLGTERVERRSGPGEQLVLCIGRMQRAERYKNYDVILDAWAEIAEAAPSSELVMVGEGDDRPRLSRRVEEEGLRSVTLAGFVSARRKLDYLARARVLVHLSTGEGFGLVAIEAAAAGVPVIGVRGEVVGEILPEGRGSMLVDATDRGEVARAVLELLEDPARAEALGEAGRRWVEQNLLRESFEARASDAIARVLARD